MKLPSNESLSLCVKAVNLQLRSTEIRDEPHKDPNGKGKLLATDVDLTVGCHLGAILGIIRRKIITVNFKIKLNKLLLVNYY